MNPTIPTPAPRRRALPATLISLTLIAATPALGDGSKVQRARERAEKPVARSTKPAEKPSEKPAPRVAPAPRRPVTAPRVVTVPRFTAPQPPQQERPSGGWNRDDDDHDHDRGRDERWRGDDRDGDHWGHDRWGDRGDSGRGYRGHGRYDRDDRWSHDHHRHRTVYRHYRPRYYDPYNRYQSRWYRDVWGFDHDPFSCGHHHAFDFDAFRLFRIPERILASALGFYRPYFYARVYYPEHRHFHAVYRFPVWDDGEFYYRPYAYCDDHLFASGWFGDDGPTWDVDVQLHIDF